MHLKTVEILRDRKKLTRENSVPGENVSLIYFILVSSRQLVMSYTFLGEGQF